MIEELEALGLNSFEELRLEKVNNLIQNQLHG